MSGVPAPIRAWRRLSDHLTEEFLGGPKLLKLNWVINVQKGGTLLFVALLMWLYQNTSVAAWVYLALHGGYGLCWIIKDLAFPDPTWQRRVTFGGAAVVFVTVLGLYWVFPFLLVSDVLGPEYTPAGMPVLALAVLLQTVGVAIMMSADAQKYFTLRARSGLITDGMFARVRHPNYLGEMMVYGSYALIVDHWIPWLILAWVWTGVFAVNMIHKEASLSRYPEWAAYRARTGWLLPKLLRGGGSGKR